MAEDRQNPEPNQSDSSAAPIEVERAIVPSTDPAEQIPVPIAMSAAEIDERAKAVEAVRGDTADLEAEAETDERADEELRADEKARADANRPDAVIESRPEEPRIDV